MISVLIVLAQLGTPTPVGPTGSPQCVYVQDRMRPHQCYDAAAGMDRDVLDWEKAQKGNGLDVRGNSLSLSSPPLQ